MPTEWSNIAHCAPDAEITRYVLLLNSVSIPRATFHRDIPQVIKLYPQEISVRRETQEIARRKSPFKERRKSSGTTTRGSSNKKKALPMSSPKNLRKIAKEQKPRKGKVDRPPPWAPFTRRCSCRSRLRDFRAARFLPFAPPANDRAISAAHSLRTIGRISRPLFR